MVINVCDNIVNPVNNIFIDRPIGLSFTPTPLNISKMRSYV